MSGTLFADRLIDHMKTCPRCRRQPFKARTTLCPAAKALVKLTTQERHG